MSSRPGVCDVCGCAVVRLTDGDPIAIQEIDCFSGLPTSKKIWTKVKIPDKGQYIVNGHKYIDGKLASVHCAQHTTFPDNKAGLDAKGGDNSEYHGYCVK